VSGIPAAVWIAVLAVACVAQLLVTIVRTRQEGAVPIWSLVALVGIALLLAVRIRQFSRRR
jgi:hypothetical protein